MTAVVRLCAACNHTWAGHASRCPYLCPPCLARMREEWDPRPATGSRPASLVRLVDRYDAGDHLVLARDGDVLTVRPLGRPDAPPETVTIANAWPAPGEGGWMR